MISPPMTRDGVNQTLGELPADFAVGPVATDA
jgi:hypothetical protein